MRVPRVHRRVAASRVAALVIKIDGDKALKDSDLAALFELSLPALYASIGRKLWDLQPRAFHKLSQAHDRGRQDARPALAFTLAGVLLVAGILGEASLDSGADIAHALKTRRRASVHKKVPARRVDDPNKSAHYNEAKRCLIAKHLPALTKRSQRRRRFARRRIRRHP